MSAQTPLIGVDGCRGGWVAVLAEPADPTHYRVEVCSTFVEVLALADGPSIAVVDMPIGLLESFERGGRDCDRLARQMLGARGSSVFPTPIRGAVEASSYAAACRVSRESAPDGGALSKQAYLIAPKIREIDLLLRAAPELRARVMETHPEVVFTRLAGEPLPSKKSPEGRALRAAILGRHGFVALVESGYQPPAGSKTDDVLDAAACLVVARAIANGTAVSIPADPPRDQFDIPMQMMMPAEGPC